MIILHEEGITDGFEVRNHRTINLQDGNHTP